MKKITKTLLGGIVAGVLFLGSSAGVSEKWHAGPGVERRRYEITWSGSWNNKSIRLTESQP
jgi:hypothetical protein